jgi:hypothetical protein
MTASSSTEGEAVAVASLFGPAPGAPLPSQARQEAHGKYAANDPRSQHAPMAAGLATSSPPLGPRSRVLHRLTFEGPTLLV